ncbi:MAG: DUF342 domain-containing protein [Lachnospiraceae bacterium]|nr:DUF342 domain-containing protein [Lachnospiraceae bacterium]
MEMRTTLCIPEVLISEDHMTVKLKLCKNVNGSEWTVDELENLIASKGVKTEIFESSICDVIRNEIYDVAIEVTRGKEPVPGRDGYYVYHVATPEVEDAPRELEDGTVDYVKTATHTVVEEGDLLAEYVPATNGEYGYTVDNKMLAPKRGKDLPMLKGKGFYHENGKYYAANHGMVEITERGFRITNLLEVEGNVDINYGHIDFDGNVNIRGDVKSGMNVRAAGNIEIKGHVGNCQIEAGKDIIVHNGMQGKFSGKLVAGGNIECKFFENSQAVAKGNIVVRSVMNSQLEAEGKVTVEGKDAVVVGGSVHAVQGMELAEAGNDTEIETLLVAGALPDTLRRDRELVALITKVEGEVDLLDRSAKIMERMANTNITKETNNRRMKIIQAKVIKSTELKKYQMEKMRSEALIQSGKDANVVVQKVIFPGCRVEIAGVGIDVKQELKHVKFVLRDGNIEAALLY